MEATSRTPRLYLDLALLAGAEPSLAREQAHYLVDVLRLKPGDPVRVFNARDGEWLAYLTDVSKKKVAVRCERRLAEAVPPPDIDYVFAPLKHARLDYVVQKATELGVRRLRPVLTERTVASRVNLDRMRANVIEAAEQCNLVSLPDILPLEPLEQVLSAWDPKRTIVYCDEMASIADPVAALKQATLPVAVFIGPEGGYSERERRTFAAFSGVISISLGARIMRADTAAVAALTLVQAVLGDWSA